MFIRTQAIPSDLDLCRGRSRELGEPLSRSPMERVRQPTRIGSE